MKLEPNDLLLFARVADSGSFSRASEQLGLPKSTISRRISQLETGLGERLLQRTTRKLVVTEFGLGILDHARQIAAETEASLALAQHRQTQPAGVLRVSMPNDFANLMLASALAEFAARHPLISLELDLSARRVDVLAEGYDLAVRFGSLPDDATLVAKRLFVVHTGLYASPAYLAQRGTPHTPGDLTGHDALYLASAQRGMTPWLLRRGEETWAGTPSARISANSPELLVRLARQGLGIVAAPEDYARSYVEARALARILPDWELPPATAWAVYPGRRLMPAKTRVFIELLETRLGKPA